MNHLFLFLFLFLIQADTTLEQGGGNTMTLPDSSEQVVDSVNGETVLSEVKQEPLLAPPAFTTQSFKDESQFYRYLVKNNHVFQFSQPSSFQLSHVIEINNQENLDRDALFYLLCSLFFLFGIIRFLFGKYLKDVFRAFFSPTLSRRQLKDQLHQDAIPSYVMNLFFGVVCGAYLFVFLSRSEILKSPLPFYYLGFFILGVLGIYLCKYLFLKMGSWLFGIRDFIDNYVFTIFLVNKVMSVVLLPFIVIIAFGSIKILYPFLIISLGLVLLLVGYRYMRMLHAARTQIHINKFHFFLYLCAFEVAPLLVVGKLVSIGLNTVS